MTPPAEPTLHTADALFPMDPRLPRMLRNAGVVVTGGVITAVDDLAALRRQFGTLPHARHRGLLLPGLINAHTHLELSYLSAGALARPHFTDWVAALIAHYPPPEKLESVVRAAARKGAADSLRAGVTCVGDISRHSGLTRQELRNGPLTAVSFGEIVALGKMRHRLDPMLAAAADRTHESPYLHIGLSPHAPYTVEGPALSRIAAAARAQHLPVCMHLAELSEENAFLRDLSGPLGRSWDLLINMAILDDLIPPFPDHAGSPIHWAHACGLLAAAPAPPVLLAHVNYADDDELALLARSAAAVACCPRTHAYFGHPPHRYRDMLASGINVCLGTDSLASNPDLNVAKEAALLIARDQFDPYSALEMITTRPARALGMAATRGSLFPGKQADLALFDLDIPPACSPDDILRRFFAAPPPASVVVTAGQTASPPPAGS